MDQLTAYLRRIRKGGPGAPDGAGVDEACLRTMRRLVKKYSDFGDLAGACPAPRQSKAAVVVLTGATGFLGPYLLHQLRQDARVKAVYCLVRAAQAPHMARARVSASMAERGMPGLGPAEPGSIKVTCLACDLTDTRHLGLAEQDWRRMRDEASVVVHAAWTVNFLLRLASFEDCIAGTRNMIDFAATSGARFFFVSSLATVSATTAETVSVEAPDAAPIDYSKSKWIAEQVCAAANEQLGRDSSASIIRVGQLCGDANGVWNPTEAFPLIFSASSATGCLPTNSSEVINWLPVDLAARAVLEIVMADQTASEDEGGRPPDAETPVYHVANPHASPTWNQAVRWISDASQRRLELVPAREWLDGLEDALEATSPRHPSKALVPLWERSGGLFAGDGKSAARRLPDVARARRVSPSMDAVEPVDRQRVLALWRWSTRSAAELQGPSCKPARRVNG